jgi:hypothetical protein
MRKYVELVMLSYDRFADVWASKAGLSIWTDYDFVGGENYFKHSIKLNPNNSMTRAGYAHLLMILNRWNEAWEQIEYALADRPHESHCDRSLWGHVLIRG